MATIPAIKVVNGSDCDTSQAKKLPGIKVVNTCEESCDGEDIKDNYVYIGYNAHLLTYTFDIASNDYPSTYWVIVDGNYELVGEELTDVDNFLTALNTMQLGTWSLVGDVLTVTGYHVFEELFSTEHADTLSLLAIYTNSPVAMDNIYGGSLSDISIENSIVANETLIENIGNLGMTYLSTITGAVIQWLHYPASTGDGWNSTPDDAVARGLDYTTQQGGDMYNGGLPYGRDFFEDSLNVINQLGITKIIVPINIIVPLLPYSNALIDWDNVPLDNLITEIDNMIAKVTAIAPGAEIFLLELGMELKTNNFADLTANPGGAETTTAEVLAKLLEHTNASSATSILDYLEAELPDAIICIDSKNWDETSPSGADMVSVLTPLSGIDAARNYWTYDKDNSATLQDARDFLATSQDFWDYVNDGDYNGKDTYISQLVFKTNSALRSTVASGLVLAETYLRLTEENLDNGNKLKGCTYYNIKQLFSVNDDYSLRAHYPFFKLLGTFFDDTQEKLTLYVYDAAIDAACIVKAIRVGSEIRIAVVNPTESTYSFDGLLIDGVAPETWSTASAYSTDTTNPVTTDTSSYSGTSLSIRPYSLTIITI